MVSSFSFSALLLAAAVLHASGIPVLNLSPEKGTSYHIRNSEGRGSKCLICTGTGQRQICNASVLLPDTGSVAVQFKCPRPEDAIHVDIQRSIDCTTQSCNGQIVAKEPDPFVGFNRTFVWTLTAVEPKAFRIDFTKTGLTQIPPSQACPDHQTFTLQAAGKVAVGTYCRTGPIGEAQVLNQGTFSLHVPAKEKLQAAHFSVSVGENIKSLARIKVVLPAAGSASSPPPVELLSPNYPQSFPDDDVVEWEFEVPSKHSAAVRVVNHTQPACRKKETGVEYHGVGRQALVLGLADPQPAKTLQNFTLTLRNCEMVSTRGTPHGLTARFSVSATRAGGASVSCSVDLRQKQGLSLVLEKIRPGSGCEMRMASAAMGKITLKPNNVAQLSFLDCSEEDVRVTATRVIECRQLKDCSKAPVPLPVPALPACLPAPLSSMTWSLVPLPDGSVVVLGPGEGLKQSLPGQLCNGSVVFAVVEDDSHTSLGQYCSQGPIQSIQSRAAVSVTASGPAGLRPSTPQSQLRAHFKGESSEMYIFTVSPKGSAPTLLASPSWPAGMQSYSTVSWIVNVPAKQDARLAFANLSQPKCSQRHANIRVQLIGSDEEMYSRREDEVADSHIHAPNSFYLNMSNCMPETGQFSMLTEITLRKSKNLLLTIIGSVLGVLLVISAVVLAVICIRKKKKGLSRPQVSIYNPAGTVFRPGESHLPQDIDEYHVYASIEDTMVYTHLLKKGMLMEDDDSVDTYRPFTGPTDLQRLPSDVNPEVGTYRPFPGNTHEGPPVPQGSRPQSRDRSMVHNDLYNPDGQSDVGTTEEDAAEPAALGARLEPEGSEKRD